MGFGVHIAARKKLRLLHGRSSGVPHAEPVGLTTTGTGPGADSRTYQGRLKNTQGDLPVLPLGAPSPVFDQLFGAGFTARADAADRIVSIGVSWTGENGPVQQTNDPRRLR